MSRPGWVAWWTVPLVVAAGASTASRFTATGTAAVASVAPGRLRRLATVDPRYQSYNVEMVEVVGAAFWKPYATPANSGEVLERRPPVDLAAPRLRALAAALGPAYLRVSGTWANTVYFHDADGPPPAHPPAGFRETLTRREWRGVVEFARAVHARLVTSFAVGPGVRDAADVWTAEQARRLLAYTRAAGGTIAAAEFFDEPSLAVEGGAPPGYTAAAFARDYAVFRRFARAAAPAMRLVGPGSVGEVIPLTPDSLPLIRTADLLAATPRPVFDVFSYHFFGAVSQRCAFLGPALTTSADSALSEAWLARTELVYDFYARLRDRFAPGTPIWLTETADAACGGNPWAAAFLDSFRYLDQLGRLARRGVQVVFHNRLAASEYGLLDQRTFLPRPNYWAALLWRRLMGTTVLDAGAPRMGRHLYAHCLPGHPGGVTLLAINTSRTETTSLALPQPAERYTLTAAALESGVVALNGRVLRLGAGDALPALYGERVPPGPIALAPASITFLTVAGAGNRSCRRATSPEAAGDRAAQG